MLQRLCRAADCGIALDIEKRDIGLPRLAFGQRLQEPQLLLIVVAQPCERCEPALTHNRTARHSQRGIELLPRLFQTTQTDKFVTIFSTKIGVFGFHRDGPVHKSRSLFMQPAHPRRYPEAYDHMCVAGIDLPRLLIDALGLVGPAKIAALHRTIQPEPQIARLFAGGLLEMGKGGRMIAPLPRGEAQAMIHHGQIRPDRGRLLQSPLRLLGPAQGTQVCGALDDKPHIAGLAGHGAFEMIERRPVMPLLPPDMAQGAMCRGIVRIGRKYLLAQRLGVVRPAQRAHLRHAFHRVPEIRRFGIPCIAEMTQRLRARARLPRGDA